MEADSSSSLLTYSPEHLPPENSSFLERNFMCRFRCLLDNSSGFLVSFNLPNSEGYSEDVKRSSGRLDPKRACMQINVTCRCI